MTIKKYQCSNCNAKFEISKYPIQCPSCKKMVLKKDYLGLLGEYLIASELISRNIYAQVTMGNMKKMDLMVTFKRNNHEQVIKFIEVKSKQTSKYPMFGGIPLEDEGWIVIFVDFENKTFDESPDFYILNSADVRAFFMEKIPKWVEEKKKKEGRAFRSNWIYKHPDCNTIFKDNGDYISTLLTDQRKNETLELNRIRKASGSISWQNKDGKFDNLGINVYPTEIKKFQNEWDKILS